MDMHWLQEGILERRSLEKYGEDAGEHSPGVRTISQYVVPDASVTVFLLFIGHGRFREQLLFLYRENMCY